jgi:hypothetical protein
VETTELKEEHKLREMRRVSESKEKEVARGWRKLQNEELHNED